MYTTDTPLNILKIANIPPEFNTGMGRVMHSTAAMLRELGHSVDLMFSSDVRRPNLGRLDRFAFPVAAAKEVRRLQLKGRKYDIVEIHEPAAAWYCAARKRDETLPACVVMSHGLERVQWAKRNELAKYSGKRVSLKSRMSVPLTLLWQSDYAIRNAQQIMCLNSYEVAYLKQCGVRPDRITQIQNGVADHFFVNRERHANQQRLLFVGSWLEIKGRKYLVAAFQHLRLQYPNLKLTLLGTGIDEQTVLASFPPEMREHVSVTSRVTDDELVSAYSSHDIFVFPSFFDAWGLVLTEAAAAGMPIVATHAGGAADVFEDGVSALLIPPADSYALACAIGKLLENPVLCVNMGAKARVVARQYSWRAAAESHETAYRKAISNDDSRSR